MIAKNKGLLSEALIRYYAVVSEIKGVLKNRTFQF